MELLVIVLAALVGSAIGWGLIMLFMLVGSLIMWALGK